MKIHSTESATEFGDAGIFKGYVTFSNPGLTGYRWPLCEIRGHNTGPRLCITAGVHVNEVSSMEAAMRLQSQFDPATMNGTVSIIPLVNQPAYGKFTEYNCPIDDRNINFTFPGDPSGSFSERLCDALQNEWAVEAACYVDLHGGDLRENVSKFVMFQRTGSSELDSISEKLAMCFDSEIVMGLPPALMQKPGRPPTGFARQGRISIMSEAGRGGWHDEASITYHIGGVLNIAAALGIIERQARFERSRVVCNDYLWVDCPATGQFYPQTEPGDRVMRGQNLGAIRDFFGRELATIAAPSDGYILWRLTHATVVAGIPILAVAVPALGY